MLTQSKQNKINKIAARFKLKNCKNFKGMNTFKKLMVLKMHLKSFHAWFMFFTDGQYIWMWP